MKSAPNRYRHHGFTLVELIMVIVIMGAIGGMVSVFMKSPIDAYFASARRAALTDVADTVVRRIARDVRKALPNSVRTSGTNCLEFIPTKTGGRYRAGGTGALLFQDPPVAATSFAMLGDYANFAGSVLPNDQRIAVNDLVVIYNDGVSGQLERDAYSTDIGTNGANWSTVTSTPSVSGSPPETTIQINSLLLSRVLDSPGHRFQVVPSGEKMVSYVCKASDSKLYRSVSSTLTPSASCPTTGPVIASNVDCGSTVFYPPVDLTSSDPNTRTRNALVGMVLSIQDSASGELVTLHHNVHIDNTP
jgi:MSHA biogenesis protein MshO